MGEEICTADSAWRGGGAEWRAQLGGFLPLQAGSLQAAAVGCMQIGRGCPSRGHMSDLLRRCRAASVSVDSSSDRGCVELGMTFCSACYKFSSHVDMSCSDVAISATYAESSTIQHVREGNLSFHTMLYNDSTPRAVLLEFLWRQRAVLRGLFHDAFCSR